jgi:hypothetical protein
MLNIQSKKITSPLCLCVVAMLLTPAIVSAASGTGDVAALRATEQKAALAKKAAEKEAKKAETDVKKATEVSAPAEKSKDAAEAQVPTEVQKDK